MAEQGNRVRIPDGTAAVCAESVFLMKIGHWGNLRRLNAGVEKFFRTRESEDLQKRGVAAPGRNRSAVCFRTEIRLW